MMITKCKKVSRSHDLYDKHQLRYSDVFFSVQLNLTVRSQIMSRPAVSHCNMNVPAVWHWLKEACIWSGHPHSPKYSIPALIITMSWCDTAPRWRIRHCCFAAYRPEMSFSVCKRVKEQHLPFLGLWLVFSEHCWPLSQQSAPSPNSAQPSWRVDQSLDARRKETQIITIGWTATATAEANSSMSGGETWYM